MDDIFAVVTIVGAALLVAGAVLRRVGAEGGVAMRIAAGIMEWRGFFIALAVIAVFRICIYELFWIPSGSMQPSLRKGEFVLVDKREYGIRAPLLDARLSDGREPEHGEIVVFRFPGDEGVFYIKRIIALPGDVIEIDGNGIRIDGDEVASIGPSASEYVYSEDRRSLLARLGGLFSSDARAASPIRSGLYWERLPQGWHAYLLAHENASPPLPLRSEHCEASLGRRALTCTVPPDSYFVMGDNRHRSNDSRFWAFVPRSNLVGPAVRIFVSFDAITRSFMPLGLSDEPPAIDGLEPPEGSAPSG